MLFKFPVLVLNSQVWTRLNTCCVSFGSHLCNSTSTRNLNNKGKGIPSVPRDGTSWHQYSSVSPFVTYIYPMTWKIQPIRGQDYRCIFCGMQRVIFHSTFLSLLGRENLLGSIWGASSETLQLLRTIKNISDHVRKFSEDFRTLPKISEDFSKILKNHKNIRKLLLNCFLSFPKNFLKKFLKIFRIFQNSSEDFRRFKKS